MRAWRAVEHGAPRDVLRLEDVDVPVPGPGEVLVRADAVTLNFNDIDGIHGRYATVPIPAPYIPGMEALGTVEAVGDGVDDSVVGTRVVAVPSGAYGGYAEYSVAPASMTFPMPEAIPLPEAATILMPFHLAALSLYVRAGLR
jgi:NADPH:quinone reductase